MELAGVGPGLPGVPGVVELLGLGPVVVIPLLETPVKVGLTVFPPLEMPVKVGLTVFPPLPLAATVVVVVVTVEIMVVVMYVFVTKVVGPLLMVTALPLPKMLLMTEAD